MVPATDGTCFREEHIAGSIVIELEGPRVVVSAFQVESDSSADHLHVVIRSLDFGGILLQLEACVA
jgi:hypothetical protein